ncbi:Bcl-2-related protein A1 [Holothuria leucospilota]|uniref:Bcl-2-related protein A1 n=1 Tax=Holothuria leucospilota TaxID=206669 RepID=A0A9Q1C9D4_HOLLE|nr:Bcl-2-related protein A1 [Holothuria leucospilota]
MHVMALRAQCITYVTLIGGREEEPLMADVIGHSGASRYDQTCLNMLKWRTIFLSIYLLYAMIFVYYHWRFTMGEVGKIARELGRDFINGKLNPQPSPYTKTLYRVGKEIDEKFETTLNEMVKHFEQCDNETIKATLDAMFEDGLFSWGRITMAYIFVRKCAQQCRKQGEDKDEQLAQFVGEYIEAVAQWIEQRGGWDFEYCEMDTDSAYLAISGDSLDDVIKPDMRATFELEKHLSFPRTYTIEHKQYDKRTPGLFKMEWEGNGVVALNSKCYYCFGSEKEKSQLGTAVVGLPVLEDGVENHEGDDNVLEEDPRATTEEARREMGDMMCDVYENNWGQFVLIIVDITGCKTSIILG